MKELIYYAHHLYKYDTKIEEYEINLINKKLPTFNILNPNGDITHEDLSNESKIMKKCLSEISREEVKALVFSSITGVVGQGVYEEVNHALSLGKKVYYIIDNDIILCPTINFHVINESRRFYATVKNKLTDYTYVKEQLYGDDYIYAVILEKTQDAIDFKISFLEEKCMEYSSEEDLLVASNGLSLNCYGRDIQKAKGILIEKYEQYLTNRKNQLENLKIKERIN